MNRLSVKKLGRRIARTWGRTAKKIGKQTANRGTRRLAKKEIRNA